MAGQSYADANDEAEELAKSGSRMERLHMDGIPYPPLWQGM